MSNPIVISSSSSGPKVVLKKGIRRWRCTKVDTKEGKDVKGNPVTKIRFHLRHENAFALKSCNAKLTPDTSPKQSALTDWLLSAAPEEFGPIRMNIDKVWELCQSFPGREWTLLTEPDGDWNNIVDVVEVHGKCPPSDSAEPQADANTDDVPF